MAKLDMGTLYQMNQQLMTDTEQFKPLTHLELMKYQKDLEFFFNMQCDCYAMLYCKELSDITIFHMYERQNPNPPALAAAECLGVCTDRGELISIEKQKDGNFEFWVRIDGEPHAYYLFPYDKAVIEV